MNMTNANKKNKIHDVRTNCYWKIYITNCRVTIHIKEIQSKLSQVQ